MWMVVVEGRKTVDKYPIGHSFELLAPSLLFQHHCLPILTSFHVLPLQDYLAMEDYSKQEVRIIWEQMLVDKDQDEHRIVVNPFPGGVHDL